MPRPKRNSDKWVNCQKDIWTEGSGRASDEKPDNREEYELEIKEFMIMWHMKV